MGKPLLSVMPSVYAHAPFYALHAYALYHALNLFVCTVMPMMFEYTCLCYAYVHKHAESVVKVPYHQPDQAYRGILRKNILWA